MNIFKDVGRTDHLPLILNRYPSVFTLFSKNNLMGTVLNILQLFTNIDVHPPRKTELQYIITDSIIVLYIVSSYNMWRNV